MTATVTVLARETGTNIDNTPIQMRALGYDPDDTLPKCFDIDRVEALRVRQGRLLGAGSEGGTVRYIMIGRAPPPARLTGRKRRAAKAALRMAAPSSTRCRELYKIGRVALCARLRYGC
jgi:hypothetical protein